MQAPSRLICAALRRTDRLDEAFSPAGQGVILLDDDGRMETMTAQAAQWLTLYFPGWAGGNRLPEQLQRGRQGQSRPNDRAARAPLANEPLVVPLEHHRLVVRLGDDPARKLLLLTEAQPTSSPELLETLGLTRREAEVLHWVAEGKSNPEIAIILP